MSENSNSTIGPEQEIDLIQLLAKIWSRRKILFINVLISSIIGILIIINSDEEYECNVTMIAESTQSTTNSLMQQFGGLLGMSGSFDTGNTGIMSTKLYPEVIYSDSFLARVASEPIYFEKLDTTMSCYAYYSLHPPFDLSKFIIDYTIKAPFTIKSMISDPPEFDTSKLRGAKYLSRDEIKVHNILKNQIEYFVELESGTLNLTVTMQDRFASYEFSLVLINALKEYLIEYQTNKLIKEYDFISERYEIQKVRYDSIQSILVRFVERNRDIVSEKIKYQQQDIEFHKNTIAAIYQALANQLEEKKIKIEEETTGFNIIEPAYYPLNKVAPNKPVIIIVCLMLGLITSMYIIFIHSHIKNLFIQIIRNDEIQEP